MKHFSCATIVLAALCCSSFAQSKSAAPRGEDEDPPEIAIGERLFLETRFAQAFFAKNGKNVNASAADPVMATLETTKESLPGPFAGQTMNCRQCHLVDETAGSAGMRTYCDFARRSPIPAREDGKTHTPRNSPPLVNASLLRKGGFLLHFDGEFATGADLVKAALTGRNYGWLISERKQAVAQIARVIRNDDGSGELAKQFGGAYAKILKGESEEFPIDERFQLDVHQASDEQILNVVANLVANYVRALEFSRDDNGEFKGSPYDVFLKKNNLPRKPSKKETEIQYGRKLLQLLAQLPEPNFVTEHDGKFTLHNQEFKFGPTELTGLKLFLSEPGNAPASSVGNCIACHAPPNFTDFLFHNTGAAQDEYDAVHGAGAFMSLEIPGLKTRLGQPESFLPATGDHPGGSGRFLAVPSKDHPERTDLGVWNVFANADKKAPQKFVIKALAASFKNVKGRDALLEKSIAAFKTPGLRDLGHSAPYLHTGRLDTLEDVIRFYIRSAKLISEGKLRNPDPEISKINLTEADVEALTAFLRALNEDYQ